MQIYYVNNDGGGFAANVDVAEGLTIGQLFEQKMPGRVAGDYLIRVDRQVVPADHVLTPGCRVSITPTKIAGARRDESRVAACVALLTA
jgi:hypothetical protein